MQYFTQYYQSYSRKFQIDNVNIMNAFCKAMFLLSYSFIISRIHVSIFRNMCLKIANFHNLSKNRQIHVINRCQLTVLMPLFSNRIKQQLLIFDNKKQNLFSIFSNMLLNIDSISNAIFYSV